MRQMHGSPRVPRSPEDIQLRGLDRLEQLLATTPAAALLDEGSQPARELRSVVGGIVAEVRLIDPIRSERLVVALRAAWRALPEVRAMRDEAQREVLWSRVLRISIEEFYEHDTR